MPSEQFTNDFQDLHVLEFNFQSKDTTFMSNVLMELSCLNGSQYKNIIAR